MIYTSEIARRNYLLFVAVSIVCARLSFICKYMIKA